MPAVRVHKTDTVDVPWDGPAEEAKLATPVTKASGFGMYAWYDPAGDDTDGDDGFPDAKSDWKFPHHIVGADGEPGAADLAGCRAGLSSVPKADIPSSDDAGVQAHLQAHLDDEESDEPADDAAHARLTAPRTYGHVSRAVFERPWAVQPGMLRIMADLIRFRVAGGVLSEDEIRRRLAAAQAQNGDRAGGAKVGTVAVIPMYGVISQRSGLMSDTSGGTSIEDLRQSLRAALNDPQVSAVVFDVDSPGGSTDGVPEFAQELRTARQGAKPIVAQVNTLCASAAYWLASSMSEIVCTLSGEAGSIGVFAAHEDVSKAAEMEGVKTTLISAGPFKTDGNQYEPLTDTARAAIQDQVNDFYSMFLADVARGRKTSQDTVAANYGQGRTLLAKPALAAGMVDRIDTLEGTITRLQRPARASAPARGSVLPAPLSIAASRGGQLVDRAWNRRMRKGLSQ